MNSSNIIKVAATALDDYFYFSEHQISRTDWENKDISSNVKEVKRINGLKYFSIPKIKFEEAISKGYFKGYADRIKIQDKKWLDNLAKDIEKPEVRSSVAVATPTTGGLTGNMVNDLESLSDKLNEFSGIINNRFNFGWSNEANVMADYAEKFQTLAKSQALQNVNLKSILLNVDNKNVQEGAQEGAQPQIYDQLRKLYSDTIVERVVQYGESTNDDNKKVEIVNIFINGKKHNALTLQDGAALLHRSGFLIAGSNATGSFYCGLESNTNASDLNAIAQGLETAFPGINVEYGTIDGASGIYWSLGPRAQQQPGQQYQPGQQQGGTLALPEAQQQQTSAAFITEKLKKIADELELNGLFKEANEIDSMIKEAIGIGEKTDRVVNKIDNVMMGKPHIIWKQEDAVKWVNTFRSWNNYLNILSKQLKDVGEEIISNADAYKNNLGTNDIQGLTGSLQSVLGEIEKLRAFFNNNFGSSSTKFNNAQKAARGFRAAK